MQVDQWSVVSPVEEHIVNLWAIVDAHKREDPDYKVRGGGRKGIWPFYQHPDVLHADVRRPKAQDVSYGSQTLGLGF